MKTLHNALAIVLSLSMVMPAFAQSDQTYWFRYGKSGVFATGDGPVNEEPGDGNPGGEDPEVPGDPEDPEVPEDEPEEPKELALKQPMRANVLADTVYEGQVTAVGGTGSYSFSGENLPSFVSLNSDGSYTISATFDDVGEYPDIIITVNDGETSVSSAPFRMAVTFGGNASVLPSRPISTGIPSISSWRSPTTRNFSSSFPAWVRPWNTSIHIPSKPSAPISARATAWTFRPSSRASG